MNKADNTHYRPRRTDADLLEALRQAAAEKSWPVGLLIELEHRQEAGFDLASLDPELAKQVDAEYTKFQDSVRGVLEPVRTRIRDSIEPFAKQWSSVISEPFPVDLRKTVGLPTPEVQEDAGWRALSLGTGSLGRVEIADLELHAPETIILEALERQTGLFEQYFVTVEELLRALERHTSDSADANATRLEHASDDSARRHHEFRRLYRLTVAILVLTAVSALATVVFGIIAT